MRPPAPASGAAPMPPARLARMTTSTACRMVLGSASTSSYRAASKRAARAIRSHRLPMLATLLGPSPIKSRAGDKRAPLRWERSAHQVAEGVAVEALRHVFGAALLA